MKTSNKKPRPKSSPEATSASPPPPDATLAAIHDVARAAQESTAPTGKPPRFDADEAWLRDVYQGDVPQLTIRSVVTGALLGAFLALSNLYVGLKAGWALGVSITACLVSVMAWRAIHRVGLARFPMSILEQNCMQSTASAAGFASCGLMVSALPAYLLVTGVRIQPGWLMLWIFFATTLGVCLSVPFKRSLIHAKGLSFPTGIATAETLRSLHAGGAGAARQARALFSSMGVGALLQWSITNTAAWWPLPRIPDPIPLAGRFLGRPLSEYTVGLDGSSVFMAAGAILGLRVTVWMVVGSALSYLVIAPRLVATGFLPDLGYGNLMVTYALWGGASIMVTSSLTGFLFQAGVVKRALQSLRGAGPRSRAQDPLAHVETPTSWAWIGAGVCSLGIVVVGTQAFAMAWWISAITVLFAVVAVLVSCRAMGETDIAPVGIISKLTQLGAGVAAPGSLSTNLMAGSVTSGASASAADLLVNQKCGYLLGAKARQQFLAQMIGLVVGTLVVVPAFEVLIPTVDRLQTSIFPAPAAQTWRFMAELMSGGLAALSSPAKVALLVGSSLGIGLSLARRRWEDAWWVPNPMGLGMGMVVFFSNSLSFLLGAGLAQLVARRSRRAGGLVVPVSSGLIAGESLMGILLAVLVTLGLMSA